MNRYYVHVGHVPYPTLDVALHRVGSGWTLTVIVGPFGVAFGRRP